MSRDWRNSLRALKLMTVFLLAVVLISLIIVGGHGVPSVEATVWSAILALVALVASSVQFIPQIIRTWKLKVRALAPFARPRRATMCLSRWSVP